MVGCKHRGFREWIVQRLSALIIGAYTAFIFYHLFFCGAAMNYAGWHALFDQTAMRVATVMVLISILWHAWIGLWTVFTDYVKHRCVRFVLQCAVIFSLIAYMVWAISILW